jgi:CRISPR associated protein Cas1
MPFVCQRCGKIVRELPVEGAFCSDACLKMYLSMNGKNAEVSVPCVVSATTIIPRVPLTPIEPPPLPETITVEKAIGNAETVENIGESWRVAGQKFDALTKRALKLESGETSPSSIIVAGNGANLSVRNECLIIRQVLSCSTQKIMIEELHRAVHNVKRIVWCSATGSVSYAALEWAHQQGIDLLVLDNDGAIIAETNPDKTSNVQTKRAQYTISPDKEIEIARWIILGKILGQFQTYNAIRELQNRRTSDAFSVALGWLGADTIPDWLRDLNMLRMYEARIAAAYFSAWNDIVLNWARSDVSKIPTHWETIGDRVSPLASRDSGQKAVRPIQAVLNYAYGILAHVSKVALLERVWQNRQTTP